MAGRAGKPVTRVPAFWDASALVALCVRQGMTLRAIALYKTYDAVVWWATPVEIASALARLMRMKQLDPADWAKARKLAKNLADSWSVIQPSDALRMTSMPCVLVTPTISISPGSRPTQSAASATWRRTAS